MYNNGNSSKNVTGSSVVDGSLDSADFPDNGLSGDKIDGGIISNFQSTGVDDRLTTGKVLTLSDATIDVAVEGLTLASNEIGGVQITIADDAVGTVTPPRYGGFMFITTNGTSVYPFYALSGLVHYDCGNSVFLDKNTGFGSTSGSLDTTTGILSGTTGLDGKVTTSPQSGGTLQIENRSGASRTFQLTFL
jgi:hypothetical protein